MKKIVAIFMLIPFILPTGVKALQVNAGAQWLQSPNMLVAQNKLVAQSKKRKKRRRSKPASDLTKALRLAKKGKYQEASVQLFRLSQSPRYTSKRLQIKYILGLMLYQMKLYQVAAFQFISVIRQGDSRYLKQSLEKLSLAADALGDDTLLNYAISRVKAESFPRVHRDMLFYRIGEFQLRSKQYRDATRSFAKVEDASPFYPRAKYLQGLAYSLSRKNKRAMNTFEELMDARARKGVTDTPRVAAMMGKARVHYQMKDWDNAIESYRQIPRDHELWHDTLFEGSWAMLRSGRFRSALGNFQSLHSPFYEDHYQPESLLVRSIVYLYICQYDEMKKVLNLFTKIYKPVFDDVTRYLKARNKAPVYFQDVVKVLRDVNDTGTQVEGRRYPIPFVVGRKVIEEGDFQRSYVYIKKLLTERKIIKRMPSSWKNAAIGKYARKTINRRLLKARKKAGRQIRAHLLDSREELVDLFEQEGFIRFEMINGKKEALKKKVAGKDLPEAEQIDQKRARDYYVQNGWQYYRFRGEYWLDELGNYHYVGTQSCN